MLPSSEIRRARPLLGTVVEIAVRGASAAVDAVIDAAFREIEFVHNKMSFHATSSDVARLNRAPAREPVVVDARTYEVLAFAIRLGELSDGAFDVTVGRELVMAGFLPMPACEKEVVSETAFRDIVLLGSNRVMLRRRAWIDLGGVAKGYAVDRAVMVLQRGGVSSGVVNAGGDLRVFGDPQPIYIHHPEHASEFFALGAVAETAVASSSGFHSQRTADGKSIDPLVNPRCRACVRWRKGITVLAPTCMAADALTKVVRLAPRLAPPLLDRFAAHAIAIDRRGMSVLQVSRGNGAMVANPNRGVAL